MIPPPKRHILTYKDVYPPIPPNTNTPMGGSVYFILNYIYHQSTYIDCIYLDAKVYAEVAASSQYEKTIEWSFAGDQMWMKTGRYGRVYLNRLPSELEIIT